MHIFVYLIENILNLKNKPTVQSKYVEFTYVRFLVQIFAPSKKMPKQTALKINNLINMIKKKMNIFIIIILLLITHCT